MMNDWLEGKPLGHPLHPLLVHLPIGLWLLSLLFDFSTLLVEAHNVYVRGAFYTMLFGLIMALIAALPGLADRADIRNDHPAKRTANTHMVLNLTAVGLYTLSLVLRYGALGAQEVPLVPFFLSLVGMGVVAYSGFLGGVLVYGEGIGVGRHRRHTPTPQETIHGGVAEARDGMVPVAEAGSLEEGQTLRAEIGGVELCIARIDNAYYAFQDYCTHRFAPLSEGEFQGHEVMCPWHRSCFDVRTGQVTEGPAKVDLRTFEVMVRDGWLMVGIGEIGD